MVILNMGLPDPSHPDEDLRVSNDSIFVGTDDDSDQETGVGILDSQEYGQYQPLSTFSNEDLDTVSDEDSDDETNENPEITESSNVSSGIHVSSIASMESTILKEVWSGSSPKVCDIEMDNKKVDEVKQLMLNITLPPSAIPDWAANIPEEEWKNHLMNRLDKNLESTFHLKILRHVLIGIRNCYNSTFRHHKTLVNVTVFYESLSPNAKDFFVTQLYPVSQGILSKYINLNLVPYGIAETIKNKSNILFKCHHGDLECYGNLIQVCSERLVDNGQNSPNLGFNQKRVGLLKCFMENLSNVSRKGDIEDALFNCIGPTTIGVVWLDLINCASKELHSGQDLLEQKGKITDNFQKPLEKVPTIVYNGVFSRTDSDESEYNFKRVLCRKITNEIPNECGSAGTHLIINSYLLCLLLGLLLFVIKKT